MERMTTAEATVAALIAHGIKTIYALPGVHNDPLFDALFKAADGIRTVHTRHEQGAGYMALGAALATGNPQAYTVVPGPGLLNSAAALLQAHGTNAPVLALIGQIAQSAIGRGYGHLHEIRDQAGIIARIVDFCARIRALPEGTHTPIIFLTALRDVETFDHALRVGGDDFLTKPVRPTELVVRVQSALKLRAMSAELRPCFRAGWDRSS